ncbi:hypothetical protein GGX14DRAFT_348174 [Mycena pura]|uniref:Putative gamma-glutamylcyclotransferase n=1 Tax=Mycena pura TaxID=153505 RepID=A0AAD7E4K9_9AGAR|nr:hypothetical protein GGX14DRAFT_348174 [Mycena pura]
MSAFFYGTLMHPEILKRVIGNDGSHLYICPAVLLEFTRHRIKGADYPGIVPYATGLRVLFDDELDRKACSVRGTMVTGLTASDIALLDTFEGDEYTKKTVHLHPLAELVALADHKMTVSAPATPLPPDAELRAPVEVDTYVYNDISALMRDVWDFDDFVAKNAWKWYGPGARARG